MKIFGDRSVAGFPAEKSGKPGRAPAKPGSKDNLYILETADDLELTFRKTGVLDSVREADTAASSSEAGDVDLRAIKQKLSLLNDRLLNHPAEALSAHAHLTSKAVAALLD